MNKTHQKTLDSNSFKAPHLNHRLTSHNSKGVTLPIKKPKIDWNNKEEINKYNREYYSKNKEKNKLRYQQNKEKIQKQHKEYYHKNKKIIIERSKVYYQKNRKRMIKQISEWRKKNPEKVNSLFRIWYKTKIQKKKIRKDFCELCNSKENLMFHHTDYKEDLGFTVCGKCHSFIHNELSQIQYPTIDDSIYFKRKKPLKIKELKEEFKDGTTRR